VTDMERIDKSEGNLYNASFSHIYVEERAAEEKLTKKILGRFPNAEIIWISHYKDVFNRSNQNGKQEKRVKSLILAKNEGKRIFPGAAVCQSFGEEHFYYAAPAMNCVFDCDYCFLKGMYRSGYIVLFTNMEDYFADINEIGKEHPLYISIAYETDLCAMEEWTEYVGKWTRFTRESPFLTIEIRTKAGLTEAFFERLGKCEENKRIIFSFTISPDSVISRMENGTAKLSARINGACLAAKYGFGVRLCFDPVMYIPEWEADYMVAVEKCFETLSPADIKDVSIGTFRVSADYLKNLRQTECYSEAVQFPFTVTKGVYHYPENIEHRMLETVRREILKYVSKEQIFEWESR